MFIRKTLSKSKKNSDKKYYTYRLVESYRLNGKVKQRTLLSLGADFNVDEENWALLASRIEDIIKRRESLFSIDKHLEDLAQQYALKIISYQSKTTEEIETDFKTIDVNTIEQVEPKSIGTENIVYETIKELELDKLFESLEFTPIQLNSALGTLISKACNPVSDNRSIEWLKSTSGAGELYGCDYNNISNNSFYRVADLLLNNKDKIENHIYNKTKEIFEYDETITLYDLTNTYFEGALNEVEKAQRGRSKEKRSDAKIITLAIVLDSSGFIKNSKIFAGNVGETTTLKEILRDLKVDIKKDENNKTLFTNSSSLVVMDAGISSEENIKYLKDNGYEYLVVSRKRDKEFDDSKACDVKLDKNNNSIVRAQKVEIKDDDGNIKEVELYCHSKTKEIKEESMKSRADNKFKELLDYLNEGLNKPRRVKKYDRVLEKVGALKEKYAYISKYYDVEVKKDPNSSNALSVKYKEKIGTDNKSALNGVYCLRTNNTELDEKILWKTYTTLTDLESVFRTLKTELGLRPIYHKTESRIEAHLFITTIVYSIIHTIRYKLKSKNINYSWSKIRDITSSQIRITTIAKCEDAQTLYIRKSSELNEKQKEIYNILGLNQKVGDIKKIYK